MPLAETFNPWLQLPCLKDGMKCDSAFQDWPGGLVGKGLQAATLGRFCGCAGHIAGPQLFRHQRLHRLGRRSRGVSQPEDWVSLSLMEACAEPRARGTVQDAGTFYGGRAAFCMHRMTSDLWFRKVIGDGLEGS